MRKRFISASFSGLNFVNSEGKWTPDLRAFSKYESLSGHAFFNYRDPKPLMIIKHFGENISDIYFYIETKSFIFTILRTDIS